MRLVRDRFTWLTYLQLGTYGYFIYAFGPTVGLLRDEQGTSRSVAALHGTALALGSLLCALLLGALVRRWGRTALVWAGMTVMCIGILTYLSTTALPVTLLGILVAAFGGSFVVVLSAPVLSDHHGDGGPSAISEANGIAAGVGTVAPLVIGACVALGLGWRPGLLLLVALVALLAMGARGVDIPRPPQRGGTRPQSGRLPQRFWFSWLVVTAGVAVEFCLVLWTGDLLRERMGLSPGPAAAGLTALVGGMCAGRLCGGRLALRWSVDTLLYSAILTAAAGFAVLWLSTSAVVGVPALVVCGLGIALFYPMGVARAIDASQGRPDQASARTGVGASLAAGVGPFVLGAVADQVGIHLALLVVPALLAVAAVGVRVGSRRSVLEPAP